MITYKNIEPTKIANNLSSSFAIHPGELIKDEIDSRNITQKQLAEKMNVSYTVLNEVLNGKRPVNTEYAILLQEVLGIDANIWLRRQIEYNLQVAKQDEKLIKKLNRIRDCAAVLL